MHSCIPAFLLVLLTPLVAHAQLYESIGIRAQGMGGAFVAVADDASATWWNPAGLATGAFFNALVEYNRPQNPPEAGSGGVAVAFPALGLSYYRLSISQMQPPASTGQTALSRQDQGDLSAYGITVGQSVGNHLVLASTLRLLRAGETHGDLDVGALARFGVLQAGLAVKNVTEPSLAVAGGETLRLRRQARAGIALVGRGAGALSLVALAFDADLTRTTTFSGDERHLAAGLELWTLGRRIGVRGGVSANTVGDTRATVSGGLSLALRSGTYLEGQATGGADEARRGWGLGLRVTF